MSPYAACLGNGQKRCRGRARLPKSRINVMTLRWKIRVAIRRMLRRWAKEMQGKGTPAKVKRKGSGSSLLS